MLVDAFIYNNEKDLLRFRLEVVGPFVDKIFISESEVTFTGISKPLYAQGHIDEFVRESRISENIARKISLISVSTDKIHDAWGREKAQRDQLLVEARKGASDKDIMLYSDCDEIPSAAMLNHAVEQFSKDASLKLMPFTTFLTYFRVNYVNVYGRESEWRGPFFLRIRSNDASLTEVRNSVMKIHRQDLPPDQRYAGWHFSYIGDESDLISKKKSISHQEDEVQNSPTDVVSLMGQRRGPYDHFRKENIWACLPTNCLGLGDFNKNIFIKKWSCEENDFKFFMSDLTRIRENTRIKKNVLKSLFFNYFAKDK